MSEEKRIMIGVPVNRRLPAKFSISLQKITSYLLSYGWTVEINYNDGSVLSSQRNKIMKDAFKQEMDLLYVDSDMVFGAEDLEPVLAEDGPMVGGLCFMRRPPFNPVVFIKNDVELNNVFKAWPIDEMPDEPFVCDAVGCAFLYIRYHTIERILWEHRYPFNNFEMKNGDALGEDLSFMHRCFLLDIKPVCVPWVNIGHITERIITRKDHEAIIRQQNENK